jgi:DNA topoisomerase IB
VTTMARDTASDIAPPVPAASPLTYVHDHEPGLRRLKRGDGFSYVDADGRAVDDAATLDRIRRLAIPPAWTKVWICPDPNGHIQAVGRDQRGRKQYRYHPGWRADRDARKYDRMAAFGRVLPRLRRRMAADLARRGLPREKVLAAVVSLLELTLIRVGNDEYAKQNNSFGLTTLRKRHLKLAGGGAVFEFGARAARSTGPAFATAAWPGSSRPARSCPASACSSMSTTTAAGARSRAATSTTISAPPAATTSRPRTSAPGPARWRRWRP